MIRLNGEKMRQKLAKILVVNGNGKARMANGKNGGGNGGNKG